MQNIIEMEVIKILVSDIFDYINNFAPFDSAEEFDNSGLLVGDMASKVENVLISLDLTQSVLNQAKQMGADLIVTHHPVIFEPLKKIGFGDLVGEVIASKMSVICAHTNLDKAIGGVNDCLARALELKKVEIFDNSSDYGRIGCLSEKLDCESFVEYVSQKLKIPVKATNCCGYVKNVAVLGGAGEFAWKEALAAGADAFVTGESKHHILLDAVAADFCFVDAGHFGTERVVCDGLRDVLKNKFKNEVNFVVASQKNPVFYCCGEKIWR